MPGEVLLSPQPKKILLPRFDTIGDIVLLEGFLEALLRRFPEAKVTLLIRRVYADLACLFPDSLDWLTTEIDPHKQSPDLSLCKKLLEDLGCTTWDLVLTTAHNRTWADDLIAASRRGSTSIAIGQWTKMPSAHRNVFEELGLSADCPYERLVRVPENSYEIEKLQILWHALADESTPPEPRLYVNEHLKLVAEKTLDYAGLKHKSFFLCFPAGTQRITIKTWPPDRFAEIIAWLQKERGLPALIAGHKSEATRIEEVAGLARAKGATPKTWLGRDGEIPILAALAEAAKLYVGNDTGPMHISAAVRTPVVAVFGGGHWPRFVPRGDNSVAIAGEMPCFGCGWDCIFEDAPCVRLVSVDDVKRAVDSLDDTRNPGRAKIRLLAASTRLSEETNWYIEKASQTHRRVEADRRERLEANYQLERALKESEVDRAARHAEIERLGERLKESEADRAARLAEIEQLGRRLHESEADREARLAEIEQLGERLGESEADRAARLVEIEQLGERLGESEADREARLAEIEQLGKRLRESEADRAARLAEIEQLGKRLEESEADRAARLVEIEQLGKRLEESEADRAARLVEIEQLGKRIEESEADRAARLAEIERLGKRLKESEADRATRLAEIGQLGKRLEESETDRAARLAEMERLGKQLAESEADRAARLVEMERLGKQLAESEAGWMARLRRKLAEIETGRAARLAEMERLGKQLAESEADRAARLVEMERLGKQLAESDAERGVLHEAIGRLQEQIQVLQSVRNHPLVRSLIKSGLVRERSISDDQKSDA